MKLGLHRFKLLGLSKWKEISLQVSYQKYTKHKAIKLKHNTTMFPLYYLLRLTFKKNK